MTKERYKQLEKGWTPYRVQNQRWVCKPHWPEDSLKKDKHMISLLKQSRIDK